MQLTHNSFNQQFSSLPGYGGKWQLSTLFFVQPRWVHPKVASTVLIRDKEDKGDNTETKKDICQNGMLPSRLSKAA
jgi:hypothetical protein